MSSVLDDIRSPADVRALPDGKLPELAAAVRDEMLSTVSQTGGHLASSLGVVELTIGLLRVFDPVRDRILWDVGHQTYAWKLLTGRRSSFRMLRRHGGISGFCNPEETPCDAFVSGHAGNALAAAEGFAAARALAGTDEQVVAVVGDASLSNGESLEALNNCASVKGKLILVINDNEMSISRNVGAFARLLGRLLTGVRYNRVKAAAERAGHRLRLTFLRGIYHRVEQAVKSIWLGNMFFESFGLRYIGPVDGHNIKAVADALQVARDDKRSVVVHVVTVKGKGFPPAEAEPTRWHGVGPFSMDDAASGRKSARAAGPSGTWSAVFGERLCERAAMDGRICALTAAMPGGTGLLPFSRKFPERFFDVGICESLLVTFAAGLAKAGRRPVVAVYSSFLQRAVDQVMHDVCLLRLPVVFAIDRAGVVGEDGRTHHGVFDIPMLRCLPGLTICQPRDAAALGAMLDAALSADGPWAIRYPRGTPPTVDAQGERPASRIVSGTAEQLCGGEAPVQLWALGDQVAKAMAAADALSARGVKAGVVDARFVKPFDAGLLARHRAAGALIVSLENGAVAGGFGEAIGADVKFGWPDEFVGQGSIGELEKDCGFSVADVTERILEHVG